MSFAARNFCHEGFLAIATYLGIHILFLLSPLLARHVITDAPTLPLPRILLVTVK